VRPRCTDLAQVTGTGGVVWSVSPEGFHTNLVVLEPGGSIPAHRNDGLDVLIVVLDGAGVATVDGDAVELAPLSALLVPRGAVRGVKAGAAGLRYLTVHAQRGPLTIGAKDDVHV
jgi:quercetin dioxygenase-like cupin family protein